MSHDDRLLESTEELEDKFERKKSNTIEGSGLMRFATFSHFEDSMLKKKTKEVPKKEKEEIKLNLLKIKPIKELKDHLEKIGRFDYYY